MNHTEATKRQDAEQSDQQFGIYSHYYLSEYVIVLWQGQWHRVPFVVGGWESRENYTGYRGHLYQIEARVQSFVSFLGIPAHGPHGGTGRRE